MEINVTQEWEMSARLNSETSGNAAINTTYVTKNSTTLVRWKKFGRIVTVELYDVDLKAGYGTDNVAVIGTGLPVPKGSEFMTSIFGYRLSDSVAILVRLRVDSSGALKPWYNGTTVLTSVNGSFTYISAS